MALSEDEQDVWRHIESELAGERRLAALSRRLTAVSAGVGLPTKTFLFWLVGGVAGLVVFLAGTVSGTHNLIVAGVGVLIATVLIAGVSLIGVGLADDRGRQRPTDRSA
jgi:hypothetical protein